MNKLIVFTAPSGAGKTTIVKHLLKKFDKLAFSVSATNRAKRPGEVDKKDYYFLDTPIFKQKIEENAFVEWEEVYENQYYGTLKSEIERLWQEGKCILFDIEVKGATNIKKAFPDEATVVFVQPPSPEVLFQRLRNRKTESEDSLKKRIARAAEELTYYDKFDLILVNDRLEETLKNAEELVQKILNQ